MPLTFRDNLGRVKCQKDRGIEESMCECPQVVYMQSPVPYQKNRKVVLFRSAEAQPNEQSL